MLPQFQPSPPAGSKVLAALSRSESPQSIPQLERVSLRQGEVVYESGSRIGYVYFPETAVFSMLAVMENGDTVEVGPVGDEGMAGLGIFLGACESRTRTVVHVAGTAMRLSAEALVKELGAGAMPRLLLRYTRMLLAMTGQSLACNKLHPIRQQFARWLLTMHDYVGDEMLLTHELIALTLGVRRAGISEYANEFRQAGLIAYERGHINIVDRRGLEAVVCECYRIIRREYDSLYSDLPSLTA